MEQVRDCADDRLIVGCIYCGGTAETREHVPSKVLLDAPLPENLPVVGACRRCNNGFSLDEEYFACFVDSVRTETIVSGYIGRASIANIMQRSPSLRTKIEADMAAASDSRIFSADPVRTRNVIEKLARGHAAFELSQPCREAPASVWWMPLQLMGEREREDFESLQVVGPLSEVGSRSSRRLLVLQLVLQPIEGAKRTADLVVNDWVVVQDGRYRCHAIDDGDLIRIKLVVSENLACDVRWSRSGPKK